MKALVLTDGKPGHVNQSLAFVDLAGKEYDLIEIQPRGRLAKGMTYLFDFFSWYLPALVTPVSLSGQYDLVVSAGSATYYANKLLSRRCGARSVAIMLPRGFRYDFDLIIAQDHDRPPQRHNLLSLPINLCRVRPQGVFKPQADRHYVSLVIGGDSSHCRLDQERLGDQIESIFSLFPDEDKLVTTSRRTSADIDQVLRGFDFSERILYSENPVNPIPDFLACSDHVFLTGDSTSMISEAVSFGSACVEVLPVEYRRSDNKIAAMISCLEKDGFLHTFDGIPGRCSKKIDLGQLIGGAL